MTGHARTPAAVAVLLAAGLAATGCGAGGSAAPTDSPDPSTPTAPAPPAATGSASPEPSASPDASAEGFPGCQELVPIEVVQAQPGWSGFEFFQQAIDASEAPNLPGPLASRTAADASARQDCIWGAPNSDSGIGIDAFRIDADAASTLVGELGAAPDEYEAFTIEGSPAFLTHAPWGIGDGVVVYVFESDAWLVMGGHEYDQGVATAVLTPALQALRAA